MNDLEMFVILITGAVIGCLGGCTVGSHSTKIYWMDRLIQEGNAEWKVNPTTGETWFKTFPKTPTPNQP